MLTCSFEGCDRPKKTRGLCNTHYMQFYKTGKTWPIGTKVRAKASERVCTFTGCDKPQLCRGLCVGHDGQLRRTGELWPLGTRRMPLPDPPTPQVCKDESCDRIADGWRGYCRTHYGMFRQHGKTFPIGSRYGMHRRLDLNETEAQARRRKADYIRAWNYGMTTEEFRAFIEAHGNRCDICGKPGDPEARGGGLVIDHDHSCCHITSPAERKARGRGNFGDRRTCGKCTRGLLCVACNAGIGQLGEDPEVLISAVEYLRRWQERTQ